MTRHCRECGQPFRPREPHFHTCSGCFFDRREPRTRRLVDRIEIPVPVLNSAAIREAIALAHPDRHPPERQERALRATQQLTIALERTRQLERAA